MSRTADRARVWPDRDNTSPAARRGNGIGFRTFAVLVAAVLPHKSASAIIAFARRQAIKGVIRTPDAAQHTRVRALRGPSTGSVMRCRAEAQQHRSWVPALRSGATRRIASGTRMLA